MIASSSSEYAAMIAAETHRQSSAGFLPKRIFDVCASAAGLVALLPLMGLVALAIALLDGRPVLFRQQRVGRGGVYFRILKFRTMRPAATGLQITADGDPRVYPFGAWLRRTKLDELPQLFNVLAGEMSFVGPRPEVERYIALLSDEQREVLTFTPGITDPASVKYRHESALLAAARDPERFYVDSILPDKIGINIQYARRATLRSDVGLILKTLFAVVAASPRREPPRRAA
jgi:lipopolysaccharide/colanic/teichoic acid biosynthesis glycosyltransferase